MILRPQRQPSLARVAVVLFSLRFTNDDRHRVLPNMESKTHTHHPLSGGWSNRLRVCCSLFGPFRDIFIVYDMSNTVNHFVYKNGGVHLWRFWANSLLTNRYF